MTIAKNRIVSVFLGMLGPLIIVAGLFVKSRGMIYYPIILLAVVILLGLLLFLKTKSYYVKEDAGGLWIGAAKTAMYDPDYVAFDSIADVEKRGSHLVLKLKDTEQVELYIPARQRKKFEAFVREKISCAAAL